MGFSLKHVVAPLYITGSSSAPGAASCSVTPLNQLFNSPPASMPSSPSNDMASSFDSAESGMLLMACRLLPRRSSRRT